MAIPTVYRSTDPGAPIMNRATAGSAVAVLRACLVDGFGSKAPAGWTEEFTGTNKAVFRNSIAAGGTGCYVRVSDPTATNSSNPIKIQAFSVMSDVDTGSDGTHELTGFRTPDQTTNAVKWVVAATPTMFYLGATDGSSLTSRHMFLGAGDAASLSIGDAYRYFVTGCTQVNSSIPSEAITSNINTAGWGGSAAAPGISFGRSYDGLSGPSGAKLLIPYQPTNTPSAAGGQNYPAFPSINSAESSALAAFALQSSGGGNIIRARLPGLYVPLFNVIGLDQLDTVSGIAGLGSEMVVLRSGSTGSNYGGLLVETALDWGD